MDYLYFPLEMSIHDEESNEDVEGVHEECKSDVLLGGPLHVGSSHNLVHSFLHKGYLLIGVDAVELSIVFGHIFHFPGNASVFNFII